ncbi:MAG: hypothetical protein WDO24_10185 [Pseudomonadota bacterium]
MGQDPAGQPVHLRDIWPDDAEIQAVMRAHITPELYRQRYAAAFEGDARWQALAVRGGDTFDWDPASQYIRQPPFFSGIARTAPAIQDIVAARALAMLGSAITTDHISPVGAIPRNSIAGRYLLAEGVAAADFNSYAARRVNHDVMMRGTFSNPTVAQRAGARHRRRPDPASARRLKK